MNHHHSSFVSEETLESLHAFKISETSIFPAETRRYLSWKRPDLDCPRLELCEGTDDGGHHTYCFSGWIFFVGKCGMVPSPWILFKVTLLWLPGAPLGNMNMYTLYF